MLYYDIVISNYILKNILNITKKSVDYVGIKNLYYPIIFDDKYGKLHKSVGLWSFSIFLNNFKRGVHMSRFINIIDKFINKPINIKTFCIIQRLLIFKLESNRVYIQVSFFYFLKKISPISKIKSFLNYKITLLVRKIDIYNDFIVKIIIPVNNLCPCSKYISNYNAHNQRSLIVVFIKIKKILNIKNIISLLEKEASSQLWSFLKRNDEKFITEFCYKNPKFVEDMNRNLYKILINNNLIKSFLIKIENFESIHNHNVFSIIKN